MTEHREWIAEAAPAKVNLLLRVLAREAAGYHQLETLFCALDLADDVEVRRAEAGISLAVDGAALGPPEQNLAWRAAEAFHAAARLPAAVAIRLRKRTPHGAGLGGGSSDAAATLRALNRLHGQPLNRPALLRIGAALGADVPFFLCGSPLALAWGRGERLLPLSPLPPLPTLVVAPPFPIGTADAYAALAAERDDSPPAPAVLEPAALRSWAGVAAMACNDFEPTAFRRFPELRRIRDALAREGAAPALLAGSGSALFGVFSERQARDRAAAAVAASFPGMRLIETSTATAAS